MRKSLSLIALLIASCQNVVQTTSVQDVSTSSLSTTTLHFPQSWLGELESNFIQQLEVRKLPNSSAGEFLFAALPNGDYDYSYEVDERLPKPRYSENVFAVNFLNGLQVRSATKQEWQSGSRIPTKSRLAFARGNDDSSGEIEYKQKRYAKVGKFWGRGMLSPGGKWLALFSYTGVKPPPDLLFGSDMRVGDVFWQIYDTVTGQKVFEWEAKKVKHPTRLNDPVVWLEERYFLFPQDEHAQNFTVVTLPAFTPRDNPVTVQFPSRRDAKGNPVPAGSSHPVWIPLVPLTKEQAAKLTAPMETEISDIRLLGTELLLAITEEIENRRANRQQRDGSGDYHYKLISTYYYALALDNPTQTRFASKEEWDRSQSVSNRRASITPEPVGDKVKATYPPNRHFPKSGTTWGSPATLGADTWIAVFSYSPANSGRTGAVFVDVYDQRLGDKLLSTALPLTDSPNELFKHALWVEGGYMLLPLNSSLGSFTFWQLP